jgi:glycosyltransferase involved in cell wall biosynthesis
MIIFLGNKLSKYGKNPTTVETLGERLKELDTVVSASDMKNPIMRIFHMWWIIWHNRKKAKNVLIDTYSTSAFHFAWTSGRLCQSLNIPYTPIIHGGQFESRIKSSRDLVSNYLKEAKYVVAPSEYLKNVIESNFDIKVHIVPNAIDLKLYDFLPEKLDDGKLHIFWLRAFQSIYNPELAIEIVNNLKNNFKIEVELSMVGPDKDSSRENVKDLISKYDLNQSVKLYGKLQAAEWKEMAKEADLFLNTTRVDNMPVSVIEAMALGLPIISTDVGGIPFLVTHGEEGYLFPSEDWSAASGFIAKLVNDTEHRKMLRNKARRKAQSMDWESAVKSKWEEILK